MSDTVDLADIEIENNMQKAIHTKSTHRFKPIYRCTRCELPNDRAKAGYAVCSDCVETANV